MTPEEKAKELIKKFTEPTQKWNEIERVWEDSPDNAKECALIVVDEIMNLDDWDNPFDKVQYSLLIFWHQVKEHINKL